MKALSCELCGSNDIIKQNGLYVCQHCGTKYTVDEARKLVDTVRIDRSSEFDKYMKFAETCNQNSDWSNAYKYYSLALEIDPTNYNAYWGQIGAQVPDMFFKVGNCSVFTDISLLLQQSFGTLLDMIRSADDGAINDEEFIKRIIKWYSLHAMYNTTTIESHVNNDRKKYRDVPYDIILSKYAPYVEYFNYMFEGMVNKTVEVFGPNHKLVNYCKQEWINYVEKFKQFYIKDNPNSVVASIRKSMDTSDKDKSKKGLWSFFQ